MWDIQNEFDRSRLKWFANIKRMGVHRRPKKLLKTKAS
jgi:hypothetical protein